MVAFTAAFSRGPESIALVPNAFALRCTAVVLFVFTKLTAMEQFVSLCFCIILRMFLVSVYREKRRHSRESHRQRSETRGYSLAVALIVRTKPAHSYYLCVVSILRRICVATYATTGLALFGQTMSDRAAKLRNYPKSLEYVFFWLCTYVVQVRFASEKQSACNQTLMLPLLKHASSSVVRI